MYKAAKAGKFWQLLLYYLYTLIDEKAYLIKFTIIIWEMSTIENSYNIINI